MMTNMHRCALSASLVLKMFGPTHVFAVEVNKK